MKSPKQITTVVSGATYLVPTFEVTNEGLVDGPEVKIEFCKGNKDSDSAFRQTGFLTETLLEVILRQLQAVNTGDLACRESSIAITKIEEATMWLNKRADDRKERNVQGTYQK